MFKLVISDDEGKTTVVPLVREEISIGRKEGNTIRLTERNVSRRHARLRRANGAFMIEDLGSYNGTKINGRRIDGEAGLKAGDQITIGDYLLALQIEHADTVPDIPPPMEQPVPPARLVMLSPPAPGAEYALSKARMKVGRAEDLDVWVNHRSISREHAEIVREGDKFKLLDLNSANGVRVNGQDVKNAILGPGDMVELGQVRFRFVGEGEIYTFDADRTLQMEAVPFEQPSSRAPLFAAAGIIAIAVVVGGVIAMSSAGDDPGDELSGDFGATGPDENGVEPTPPAPSPPDPPEAEVTPPPVPEEVDVQARVDACNAALRADDLDTAVREASEAIGADPDHDGAVACQAAVLARREEQDLVMSAVADLEADRVDEAYQKVHRLPQASPLRDHPDVHRIVRAYAETHLEAARRGRGPQSIREARYVIEADEFMHDAVPGQVRRDASTLIRTRQIAAGEDATPPGMIEVAPMEETPTPPEVDDRRTQIRECVVRGDQPCIVRLLRGNARDASEMAILIEAYNRTGQTAAAQQQMRAFIQRYPNHSRTSGYRQRLGI